MPSNEPSICVFGDQTIDWAIEPEGREQLRYSHERLHARVNLRRQFGGIFLLEKMMKAKIGADKICRHGAEFTENEFANYNHSYAVFAKYARDDRPKEKEGDARKAKARRVERYLGFRRGMEPAHKSLPEPHGGTPKVIVIDDANLGYRDQFKTQKALNAIIPKGAPDPQPWVLLKMSDDAVNGDLWEMITKRLKGNPRDWLKERIIVQVSAARLRERHADISRDLSWERSVSDVLVEIKDGSPLESLKYCRFLIVSFGPTGALLIGRDETPKLVYDETSVEGDWEEKHKRLGMMFGYGSCLCTCLGAELANNDPGSAHTKLVKGIRDGLTCMQRLHEKGFECNPGTNEFTVPIEIFTKRATHKRVLKESDIPEGDNATSGRRPRILSEPSGTQVLKVAKKGLKGLKDLSEDLPVGKFGELVTVDREEIESLRAIRNLVSNYCDKAGFDTKPLALAVFGGPGSGKSYAIKQLVKPWQKDGHIAPLDPFNLSQFNTPSDLVGALHSIRDAGLRGSIPLAFWDEFDTSLGMPLGWLRYFLAPIQDGQFQQGDQVHLIGPSVFVFAGGTFPTFAEFNSKVNDTPPETKAVDFVSRLQGYIDIPSVDIPGWSKPSARHRPSISRSTRPSIRRSKRSTSPPDGYLMLRRALILNSLLKSNSVGQDGDGSFDVDDAVLRAFLGVPGYEHGVRSMEAIIKMSSRGNGEPLNRSAIPTLEQINLHVDGEKFLDLMHQHE
ncbi:hypothetical protein BX286_0848 [Streptomyces sp. 3211.6]|uniref:hypothetical protein n=1 Tax=Streptomyces sp. 3211.6 TaxID=1938845 RepID=UPI000F23F9D0|nr:hypothetical protein [Streptomyces sp. 3211.6]RKT02933.1 hypothetical protein BX286_0848 [Streptomyces sp. 3211.6]